MLTPVRTKIIRMLRSVWFSFLGAIPFHRNTSNPNKNKAIPNVVSPSSPPEPSGKAPNTSNDVPLPKSGNESQESKHTEDDRPSENGDANRNTKPIENGKQPQRRGGQRWRKDLPQPDTSNKRCSSLLRPRLICREDVASHSWNVILSAYKECPLERVYFENENPETIPEADPEEHLIVSLRGNLIVECGNEYKTTISLFDENEPLIFKLQKHWTGTGHRVSRITRGHFILIAPNTWERTGEEPAEPNNCTASGFKVHFLNTMSGEDFGNLGKWKIPSPGQVIKLTGEKVFDNSEEGDLFINHIPGLEKEKLSGIVWARIGEEKRNGKGVNFKPHEECISEVLGNLKGKGHFFLRVYDKKVDMVDSVDFRYLDKLKQIRINDEEYTEGMLLTPKSFGYPPTKISFIGNDGAMMPQLLNNSICKVTSSGIIEVPPNKKADTINCVLKSSDGKVKITLNLQRIWWCKKKLDSNKFSEWRATPFDMTQKDFLQHAEKKTRIYFSLGELKSIPIGFGNENELVQQRCKDGIPLSYFTSHDEIINKLEDDTYLNVMWNGKILPIIHLHPDPSKPEKTHTKQKKKETCLLKPDRRIAVRVKCSQHGWRNGKGFSSGEVKEAGSTLKEAKRQFLPLDRRRTVHQVNVKTIRKVLHERSN